MGKFDLGVSTSKVEGIDAGETFLNDLNIRKIEKNIEEDFVNIASSLNTISNLLNQSVNKKIVNGSRSQIFKGWARKAKSQANAANSMKNNFSNSYKDDLKNYLLLLLDKRIIEIEDSIHNVRGDINA